jgi:salicylate hydroxylase
VANARPPILIAGAGIGGLAAALALARANIDVQVLEAAPEFAELGAGLQIGPNGTRILAGWDLGERLREVALQPRRLLLKDGLSGALLARLPLGDAVEKRYGSPYLVMPRHALHGLLLEAVRAMPNVTLSCGMRVETCSAFDDHVFVGGANGSKPLEGSALIAADGVHSALRAELCGVRAAPSGKIALRAIAPSPAELDGDAADAICVWMGPDAHLVHYPIGGERLNVVAVLDDGAVPVRGKAAIGAGDLASLFRNWAGEAQDIVAAGDGWLRWPLFTLPALAHWSRGAVTLIGDAAHSLPPFLASGAVMAIEDAAVLAEEVARTPGDCAAAFQRYEARRVPRLARLRAAVRRTGEIYHMRGAMRLARNLSLAALPRAALVARNDWLYGFRV